MRTTQRLLTNFSPSIASLHSQWLLIPRLWDIKKTIITPEGPRKFAQLAVMEHDAVAVTYNLESRPLTPEMVMWSIAVTLSSPQPSLNRSQVRFEGRKGGGEWGHLHTTPLTELSNPLGEGLVYSLVASLDTGSLRDLEEIRLGVNLSHSGSQVLSSAWEVVKVSTIPLQDLPFSSVTLEGSDKEYELTYAPISQQKVTYLGCNMVIDSNLKLHSPQRVLSTESFSYPCGVFNRGASVIHTDREGSGPRGFRFSPHVSGYLTGVSLYRGGSSNTKVLIDITYHNEDGTTESLVNLEYSEHVSSPQWVDIPFPEALGLEAGRSYSLTYKDEESKIMVGRGRVLEETSPLEYLGTIEGGRFHPKGSQMVTSSYGIDLLFDLDNIYQPIKGGKKGPYGTQLIPRCITLSSNFEARLEVRHQSIWGTWQTYDPLTKIITVGGKRVKSRTDDVLKWSFELEVDVMTYEKAFKYRVISDRGYEFAQGEAKLGPDSSTFQFVGETYLEPSLNLQTLTLEVLEPRYEIDLATGKASQTDVIKTHKVTLDLEKIEIPEEVKVTFSLESPEPIEIDEINQEPPLEGFEYTLTPKRDGIAPLEALGHLILKTRENVIHNKAKMIL